MKLSVFKLCCAIVLSGAVGIAYADEGKNESGKGREKRGYSAQEDWKDKKDAKRQEDWNEDHREDDRRRAYFYEHGYTRLNIPPGHYPLPGECRIWFPDRPLGHQPPPGGCRHIPPGAWVIHHPYDHPNHVHVSVYEPDFPGEVYVIGEFEIDSGAFLRVILGD